MIIRRATESDARMVAAIYNYYIVSSTSTFETEPVDTSTIASRMRERLERHDWLVGDVDGRIAGYAYYGSFRSRPAYGHTVESTVYVDPDEIGKGYGRQLYAALLGSAGAKGFKQAIGFISLPSPASIALHRSLGFEEAGLLQAVGFKFDRYIDVAVYQRGLTA
ncbi:MAG TPA: GNAT family N-acetyltransferase [Candidatus Eremiobacteraceae bacterium]|nr:GNAT family N-acetyltransferase [Candidatus Eremiobacteraceae bacterium]